MLRTRFVVYRVQSRFSFKQFTDGFPNAVYLLYVFMRNLERSVISTDRSFLKPRNTRIFNCPFIFGVRRPSVFIARTNFSCIESISGGVRCSPMIWTARERTINGRVILLKAPNTYYRQTHSPFVHRFGLSNLASRKRCHGFKRRNEFAGVRVSTIY